MEEYPQLVVGRIVSEIVNQDKYKDFNLEATGMPVLNYEKRSFYSKEAGRVFGMSLLITFIVLIILLRSFAGVLVPLIIALSSILWIFGGM